MIKTIVTGAAGRMGGRVIALLAAETDMTLCGAVEFKGHPRIGQSVASPAPPDGTGAVRLSDDLAGLLPAADVVIDFTAPSASLEHLRLAVEQRRAIVIGTTGLDAAQRRVVETLGRETRCVFAPNMSVGVNVLFRILEDATRILGADYDVEILETHHHLKKDAPSGTAMKMAQICAAALGRDLDRVGVYERRGLCGERRPEEIGIQTLRAGDIVGEHTVLFGGTGERLEFIHRAHSRDNFVHGALRAARWLVDQPDGLYDMQDVLGLKQRP